MRLSLGQRFSRARMAFLALALAGVAGFSACSSVNPDYVAARPHHRPDGFTNLDGSRVNKPLGELLRWNWAAWREGLPKPPSQVWNGYAQIPMQTPDFAALHAYAPAVQRGDHPQRVTLTWIGHATMLLQIGGLNVLIDPVFGQRVSPVSWAGPVRRAPLPAKLDQLPRIDVVLISHNHYDHLELDTVLQLQAQPGGAPLFIAPLGVDRWLREQGVPGAKGLDWWESTSVPVSVRSSMGASSNAAPMLKVDVVPAHHWSSRSPFDRNASLWGGFVLTMADGWKFYYSGDTGYSDSLKQIGDRLGPFDDAALPIGAYEPRWFMAAQHTNPDEAVKLFKDLRIKRAMGVHWGTFELTDESLDQPLLDLAKARADHGLTVQQFDTYRHGETRLLRP